MLVTLYKNSGVHFRLLGTNGFHLKAKNERSTTGKRGHIVAHDVSWARKRAGHKMNVVFRFT